MSSVLSDKAEQDLRYADALDGLSFEVFMTKVLNEAGYHNVVRTPSSNDHGIDAYSRTDSIAWQFKDYASGHKVPFHAVEECMFGSRIYNLRTNVVLTNSTFSKETFELVNKANFNNPNRPIILVDRRRLFNLFAKMEARKPAIAKKVKAERIREARQARAKRIRARQRQQKIQRARDFEHKKLLTKLEAINVKSKYVDNFFKIYFNGDYIFFFLFIANQISNSMTPSYDYKFKPIHSFNRTVNFSTIDYYPQNGEYYSHITSHIVNNMYGKNYKNMPSEYALDYIPQKALNRSVKNYRYPKLQITSIIHAVHKKEPDWTNYRALNAKAPSMRIMFTNALYNPEYKDYWLDNHTCGVKKHLLGIPYYEGLYKGPYINDDFSYLQGGYNVAVFDINAIYYILKLLTHGKNQKQIKEMVNYKTPSKTKHEDNGGDFATFVVSAVPALIVYWITDNKHLSFIIFIMIACLIKVCSHLAKIGMKQG